jgi:Lysylphosphatidylglycerol synthase TM region
MRPAFGGLARCRSTLTVNLRSGLGGWLVPRACSPVRRPVGACCRMRQELLVRIRGARGLAGPPSALARRQPALRIALTYLVTVAALAWLMTRPTFGAALDLLQHARIQPLLLALALIPALQWLRALRFSVVLSGAPRPPCRTLFKLTAQLSALNLALPFKVGDFSFPLLARRALGVGAIHAATTMLWCRLCDLCVVCSLLLLYGALALLPASATAGRALMVGAAVALLLAPCGARHALGIAARGAPARRLSGGFADSLRRLRDLGPQRFCLPLTLAIWLTHGWIGYLAARAVADELTFVAAGFAGAASNLAFALPITGVAGLGPPQAAWSASLQMAGASWEAGVASALMAYGCLLAGSLLTAAAALLFPASGLRLAAASPAEPL